jgi:hypothetical protein
MKGEGGLPAALDALSTVAASSVPVDEDDDCERAVFDVRLHITAADRAAVYSALKLFVNRAQKAAPEGVVVRYWQLRDGRKSRTFRPTIWPIRAHHK